MGETTHYGRAIMERFDVSELVFGRPGFSPKFTEGIGWSVTQPDGVERSMSIEEVGKLVDELRRVRAPLPAGLYDRR